MPRTTQNPVRTYLQTGEALLGLGALLLEQLLRLQLLGVALAGRLGLGQVPGRAEEDGVGLAAGGRDRLHGGGHGELALCVGIVRDCEHMGRDAAEMQIAFFMQACAEQHTAPQPMSRTSCSLICVMAGCSV